MRSLLRRSNALVRLVVQGQVAASAQVLCRPVRVILPAVWNRQ